MMSMDRLMMSRQGHRSPVAPRMAPNRTVATRYSGTTVKGAMVPSAGYHRPFHDQAVPPDRDRKICVFAYTKMK